MLIQKLELKYDTGVLKAKIQGAAISEIEILETPVGLNEVTNLVFAENNDNGIGINSCFTNTTGIVTCFLATPIIRIYCSTICCR